MGTYHVLGDFFSFEQIPKSGHGFSEKIMLHP
jgi:hypothetical protein